MCLNDHFLRDLYNNCYILNELLQFVTQHRLNTKLQDFLFADLSDEPPGKKFLQACTCANFQIQHISENEHHSGDSDSGSLGPHCR